MLEICPTIAKGKPSLEVHPLGIGGKADPVRLVFDTPAGPGLNASLIDLGNRFRLLVNEVRGGGAGEAAAETAGGAGGLGAQAQPAKWRPRAGFTPAARTTPAFSQAVTTEMLEDFAEMAGIELVVIDAETRAARSSSRSCAGTRSITGCGADSSPDERARG